MSELLVLLGIVLAGASGVPGLFLSRQTNTGQYISVPIAVLGAGLGLAGVGVFWWLDDNKEIELSWSIAVTGAAFAVAMDGLSALFLVPIFLIFMLGSIYGLDYWKQTEHAGNGRKLRLFYGTMAAGMALLVVASNSIVFLVGWEIMALSAFFLVATEDDQEEVREAAWIYFVATHVATLSLFALFALLYMVNDSFTLTALNEEKATPGIQTAIFVLALVAFGLKGGVMPLHIWLPSAHAMAPSHVSAMMSGVIIKMGIFGILRITALFPKPPLEWGEIVLGLGVVSGILGVGYAIGQHDVKRLLAYHSIENIGIIVMGIGVAMIGRSLNHPGLVVLGLSGALLHVWNHALFKALLFLSAGSVIHAVHTREIDHLGGLARLMPRTALFFLIGAVAICGLPPLNGFVSEFLIYLGIFSGLIVNDGAILVGVAFAAPALALIGALAAACFVKVYGAVFLGTARSAHAEHAHESGPSMIGPMGVLAGCCIFIGLAPPLIGPLLDKGVSAWAPQLRGVPQLALEAPLGWISAMAVTLLAVLLLTGVVLWHRLRGNLATQGPTWGCGYAAPTSRIQYTSSSFAQMLVWLLRFALHPRIDRPKVRELFPRETAFHSTVPDVALDEAILPSLRFGAWVLSWFRVFQQGSVHAYLLYVFMTVFALLFWLYWR